MSVGSRLVAAPRSPLRGVVAALVVMALVATPFYTLTALASNLLVNGSMESYSRYATDPGTGTPLTVASGWTPFVENGTPYFMSTRQFNDSVWGCHCWVDAYDGEDSQIIFTPNGSEAWTGGLFQRVSGLTVGVAYALSGRVASNGNYVQAGRKVGVDLDGGTDPSSPTVVWGDESWATAKSGYQNKYISVVAKSNAITVFVRMENPGGAAPLSEGFLDAFVLEVAPVAHTLALPANLTTSSFSVNWGLDEIPAGTLFDRFQVQVRQGGGPWSYWLDNTKSTSSQFNGADCQTYYFQTRAVAMYILPLSPGQLGNRLPSYLPGGDGQTRTTVISTLPASQVNALGGTQQCIHFPVAWTGAAGSCGVNGYDIQVRDGAGPWTDWLSGVTTTAASFRGADGRSYSFRSRARGVGGYLEPYLSAPDASTTVAFVPPAASIGPLPAVAIAATFPVTWSGGSAGCGIAGYDVFTRSVGLADDADSGWAPWLAGTLAANATFSGTPDTWYAFRVRARDTMGNVSEGSASTSVLTAPRSVLPGSHLAAQPATPQPGQIVTYSLEVTNQGDLSTTARLTQTLPVDHMILLTGTVEASVGTPQVAEAGITWTGDLAPAGSVMITWQMRLDEDVDLGEYITATAQIQDGMRLPISRAASLLVPFQQYLPLVAAAWQP